eukprot:COSAG06_NODE_15444_length_1070_cov_2.197734_1_plen_193_part_00
MLKLTYSSRMRLTATVVPISTDTVAALRFRLTRREPSSSLSYSYDAADAATAEAAATITRRIRSIARRRSVGSDGPTTPGRQPSCALLPRRKSLSYRPRLAVALTWSLLAQALAPRPGPRLDLVPSSPSAQAHARHWAVTGRVTARCGRSRGGRLYLYGYIGTMIRGADLARSIKRRARSSTRDLLRSFGPK